MGSLASGLYAAILLARGRAEGLRYVAPDLEGALRSFWALPLTLPAAICLWLINLLPGGIPPHAGHTLALELLAFTIGWLGFAVISFHALSFLGFGSRWPRFIATWNWCNVVENVLVVLGTIPGLLGAPTVVDEAAQLFAFGWAVWIEWFAIRKSLETSGFVAAWIVLLDLFIGQLLAGIIQSLA